MKAVRMYAPRDLRVEEVDIPSYASDECLIKVMAVGVCGSDIPRVNQYGAHVSPIIVGHEFGGQIVETGADVTKFKVGDKVTLNLFFDVIPEEGMQASIYETATLYYVMREKGRTYKIEYR